MSAENQTFQKVGFLLIVLHVNNYFNVHSSKSASYFLIAQNFLTNTGTKLANCHTCNFDRCPDCENKALQMQAVVLFGERMLLVTVLNSKIVIFLRVSIWNLI